MKRIIDIIASLLALILVSPIMLAISIAIKCDSRGDVFFRQFRVGKSCRLFKIYKFRSMVTGADRLGPYYTSQEDSRVTRVGRILRKTSLDELPQLINVLYGDMSLVGPRPDVEAQRELYTEQEWQERHKVRPGITGLAQATLRSSATMDERKSLDLEYVKKSSVWFDIQIIIWTIKQVTGKGSY